MADIPLRTRDRLPPQGQSAKPPYELVRPADSFSGQQQFGAEVANFAGDLLGKLTEIQAANESHEFLGMVETERAKFDTFLTANPGATVEEINKQRDVMIQNISAAGNGLKTQGAKRYSTNWLAANKNLLIEKANTTAAAQGIKTETTKFKLNIDEIIKSGKPDSKDRVNFLIDKQVEAGLISPDLQDAYKKQYGREIDVMAVYNNIAALKTRYNQTGDLAYIDDAKKLALSTNLLDEKEKQSLYANIESYEIQSENRKKRNIYTYDLDTTKELLDKLDKNESGKELDMDDVQAKFPKDKDTVEYFQKLIKGSKKEVVNTKPRGHNAALGIIYSVSAGDMGKLAAYKDLAELRYDKGVINDKTYQWAKGRVGEPYPREISANIKAVIQSSDSWWTTKSEQKEQQNFLNWVEKQISSGKEPTLKEMKSIMNDLVSQKPISEVYLGEEKRIEVIDAGGNLFTIPASKLEIATKKYGFKAVE
jgi:hypothetical protein